MADLVPILWASKSSKDRSGLVTSEKLVNCFFEPNPDGAKDPFKVISRPGLKYWSVFGSGPIRGMFFAFNRLFVVSGNELYVAASDKTSANLGAVPGGGPTPMIANDTHVGICTPFGFYNATTAALAATDAIHYSSACYQDGYGILTLYGSDQFFLTGLDDFTAIDPLDFTSVDTFPDEVKSGVSMNRNVTMFGETAIEQYYNSGDAAFPFSRVPGGTIQVGCMSGASVTQMQDVIGWLANDFSVRLLAGNSHKVVSTPGVEKWLKARVNPSEGRGLTYRIEGHEIFALNFSDGSIAYDLSADRWHDLESKGEPRWRAECTPISDGHYIRAWGLDLVGDYSNGNIYELDLDASYDEVVSGTQVGLSRVMYSMPLHAQGRRIRLNELIINGEMGVGLAVGTGSDPQFAVDWSDDGGNTWSNQVTVSAGKIGEYTQRAVLHRLGMFRNRILRISIDDPVKFVNFGAFARMDVMND